MSFKSVQAGIAKKQGISAERAGAILAAGTRRASPAAKRANPKLKKVKGGNTLISASSMKGQSMGNRTANLADKEKFCGRDCNK
jgi:hypothetical protein